MFLLPRGVFGGGWQGAIGRAVWLCTGSIYAGDVAGCLLVDRTYLSSHGFTRRMIHILIKHNLDTIAGAIILASTKDDDAVRIELWLNNCQPRMFMVGYDQAGE